MLYHFLTPLAEHFTLFNLFSYLTFRTGGAILTAFFGGLVAGPHVIRWLHSKQGSGQPIREIGPDHFHKTGTPTMGGLLILLSSIASTLLWADLRNTYVWIVLMVFVGFGAVGFIDDYAKLTKKSSAGISAKVRLTAMTALSLAAAFLVIGQTSWEVGTGLAIPFFKDLLLPLSFGFLPFVALVLVGSANAVNLTDGLDGLAIVPVMIATCCLGLIAYLVSHIKFADYLQLYHIRDCGEIAVLCGGILGAGLAFLWYNAPPAAVFMGDTGSLALGGALGTISVITKHELVWAIIGGLFVLETVSVMIQVASFKLTGKRVFRMAPLHHHFEKKGWSEPTVVIRFWIISIVLALVGLATLKLR